MRRTAALTILMRVALALLLACALLARLASPGGWMPSADGVGLTLCPDFAPAPHAGMGHGGARHGPAAPEKHDKDGAGRSCAFTAAALALHEPEPPAGPTVPPTPEAAAAARPIATAPGRGLAAPPPFATGPPLRA